ncbi:MAG: hypothetical protein K9L17_12165 [Clostridiales bacterium]|nr:hypothetical protein [Clostridiales bacterium]MCF8023439.1 hypothetical protein [Clostridiales bacterium]
MKTAKKILAVLLFATAMVLFLTALIKEITGFPYAQKNLKKEVMGFYVGEEPQIPSSYHVLSKEYENISSIVPFYYRLKKDSPAYLELFGPVTKNKARQVINIAHAKNIRVYALVHNLLYNKANNKEVVHQVLSEPQKREELVENIYSVLKDNYYDGICLDIENIYADDRNKYISLLKLVYKKLKSAGYEVIAAVPARISDEPRGGWGDNFNYAQVKNYADKVIIMAYDEYGSFSGPGPIASKEWVDSVIRYALTKMSPDKIILGVPGYGFDWNIDSGRVRYLSYNMAVKTASNYQQKIRWNLDYGVPYFTYEDKKGSEHSVYFEDARSLALKLDLVNDYNVGGVALWRLGMEDPDCWKVIREKFSVHQDNE